LAELMVGLYRAEVTLCRSLLEIVRVLAARTELENNTVERLSQLCRWNSTVFWEDR